jgi:NAD(P)H-hydrate epimerase
MVQPWTHDAKLPGDYTAILIGPGLAAADLPAEMKATARRLWRDLLIPVIVDASALDWLPLDPVPRNAIRLVTPHPGEAARLAKATVPQVQARRPEALRDISRNFGGCWVALKGYQTLVGRHSGAVFVNSSGNPQMAQGGSGDLLAGYLGGLLAQPPLQADPLKTIRYAVWQHGAAAESLLANQPNFTVEDLAQELGRSPAGGG